MVTTKRAPRPDFASDNCAGVHPKVLLALDEANGGYQASYGADSYTDRVGEVVQSQFGPDAKAFPVFNGTGANILSLQALAARWEAVICADIAHLHTSEYSAPERSGFKLLTLGATAGRVSAGDLAPAVAEAVARHRARPGVISITQSTELGTCYSLEELAALTTEAERLGLRVHMDGSRLVNAAAYLDVPLKALTAGVDAVSFGVTKNGAMFGDWVVVLNPEVVRGVPYLHKAVTQLPSKTRFVSAQLLALFRDQLWLRNARAANLMARRLANGLAAVPGVRVLHPVQANSVFVTLPDGLTQRLRERYSFSTWQLAGPVARLMTAFDTHAEAVDDLVSTARVAAAELGLAPS